LDGDRILFTMIDVTGHGVSAALLVNRYHAEFERLGREGKRPGELMRSLNTFIMDDFKGTDMYVSGFCGLVDSKSGEMFFSNYGHPPPLLYLSEEEKVIKLEANSSFLGIPSLDEEKGERRVPVAGKDRLLLYTDGLTEARNGSGDQYGLERLEDFLLRNARKTPLRFNTLLISDVNMYREGRSDDDICIMTIGLKQ
ncbi:MAG: SpoIIE family protein phosphatase, partial [Candidatus Omnitrophica bacterium]|nr:SpoIIE family protein phosphatase [Candidatus Omnitrophota bacterium]